MQVQSGWRKLTEERKMSSLNVLVLGSGGREHALCEMIKKSPKLSSLWVTRQNGGMDVLELDVSGSSLEDLVQAASASEIDLVVAGGEDLLVEGAGDKFRESGIAFAGPTKAMAQLESSKSFAKRFCIEFGIPTPKAVICSSLEEALSEIDKWDEEGVVVKADGLAAGKGVVVCTDKQQAREAILACMGQEKRFGRAGGTILLEEKLEGEEMSFFVLCDGTKGQFIGSARDYKRAYDQDKGPNTGGMGVVSPSPLENKATVDEIMKVFVEPTLAGMRERGMPYLGVLFLGMMYTVKKGWQLLEYNVRFGDPECQALAMRVQSGMLESLHAMAMGHLPAPSALSVSDDPAVVLVVARNGYPEKPEAETMIASKEALQALPLDANNFIFHASTRVDDQGIVYAHGGRILALASRAIDLSTARDQAYRMARQLNWQGGFYRSDIGDHSC